mmetsp:Transcript_62889/g.124222  ORF Transcript_62889/g.124222 Transcript_62889/m.124222 type:complete len:229 (+) Transcript_62889:51-737(+)
MTFLAQMYRKQSITMSIIIAQRLRRERAQAPSVTIGADDVRVREVWCKRACASNINIRAKGREWFPAPIARRRALLSPRVIPPHGPPTKPQAVYSCSQAIHAMSTSRRRHLELHAVKEAEEAEFAVAHLPHAPSVGLDFEAILGQRLIHAIEGDLLHETARVQHNLPPADAHHLGLIQPHDRRAAFRHRLRVLAPFNGQLRLLRAVLGRRLFLLTSCYAALATTFALA